MDAVGSGHRQADKTIFFFLLRDILIELVPCLGHSGHVSTKAWVESRAILVTESTGLVSNRRIGLRDDPIVFVMNHWTEGEAFY